MAIDFDAIGDAVFEFPTHRGVASPLGIDGEVTDPGGDEGEIEFFGDPEFAVCIVEGFVGIPPWVEAFAIVERGEGDRSGGIAEDFLFGEILERDAAGPFFAQDDVEVLAISRGERVGFGVGFELVDGVGTLVDGGVF